MTNRHNFCLEDDTMKPSKINIWKIDEESQDEPIQEFNNSPDRDNFEEEKRIDHHPSLRKIYSDQSPAELIKHHDK